MSMTVTVTTRPTTLNEAELSKRIHEAVARLIEESGGMRSVYDVGRTRTLYEYPHADGSVTYEMGGLTDEATHYVHVDGAAIPHPKVVHPE